MSGRSDMKVKLERLTGHINVLELIQIQNISMNKPLAISIEEWKEIMQVPEVKESWGIEDETPEEFADMVYGVKFEFMSGSPGYVGDIFILQGDTLTGDAPFVLLRHKGALTLAD
jgi:hypothetical protein